MISEVEGHQRYAAVLRRHHRRPIPNSSGKVGSWGEGAVKTAWTYWPERILRGIEGVDLFRGSRVPTFSN